MGDPRKLSRKYETPKRLWNTQRITEEHGLKKEFGLKNARELWIARTELRKIRGEARKFLSLGDAGVTLAEPLLKRAIRLGFAKEGTTLDGLLTLDIRHILERRLQTRVQKLGLAKSMNQARQLITHGFIAVNGSKVSSPSYVVPMNEEKAIALYKNIDLSDPMPKPKELKRHGSTVDELAAEGNAAPKEAAA
ncbi:MAG: 30S ribosomal protein S4 [Candidatus Micrarchaeia archaeon]|jgi:small subunit ribosomal protein S4